MAKFIACGDTDQHMQHIYRRDTEEPGGFVFSVCPGVHPEVEDESAIMTGMIWYLAHQIDVAYSDWGACDPLPQLVKEAMDQYKEGLEIMKRELGGDV